MSDLSTIGYGSENGTKKTITTLEIAEMMELPHWQILRKLDGQEKDGEHVKGIMEILGDNNIVVTNYFISSSYLTEQNKEMPCYNVTKMGCDFLANKFTGEKGIVFTARYVKRFREMEQNLIPKNYPSALRALADTVEQKQALEEQNRLLLTDNEIMKPKAEFFDELVDRNLLVNFRDAAKTLNIKQSRFVQILEEKGYIYKTLIGEIKPVSGKGDGLFKLKPYNSPYSDHTGLQTMVTPKGLETFRLLFKNIA